MRPLYHCKSCGFVSTLGYAFTGVAGVLLDKTCFEQYQRGEQPVTQWVEDALAKAKAA